MEVYYRIVEVHYSAGVDEWGDPLPGGPVRTNLHTFTVVKHTPCGVVILDDCANRRFINRSWTKQFALPTVEEAIVSYKARKRREIEIMNARVRSAEEALRYLDRHGFYYDGRAGLQLQPKEKEHAQDQSSHQ